MSKVISVEVDWMEKWANFPQFIVKCDSPLKTFEDLIFENREDCYVSVDEDIVDFLFYSKPSTGFGGRHFKCNMIDGTVKELIGPWSGCSSGVNKLFPELNIVEVTINELKFGSFSGAVKIKSLIPFLKEQNIRCGFVDEGFGVYFQPLKEDGSSKSGNKVIKEF